MTEFNLEFPEFAGNNRVALKRHRKLRRMNSFIDYLLIQHVWLIWLLLVRSWKLTLGDCAPLKRVIIRTPRRLFFPRTMLIAAIK